MTIGVFGAGAVGCYFGARLAQQGTAVTLVGRQRHVDAIRRDGLVIEGRAGTEVVSIDASTDVGAIADADVVLVTVKSVDTEAAADLLAAHISSATLIVSLQNGVDNAWRLQARLPHAVVPGVVYVSTEMAAPGIVRHNGGGRLVLGRPLGSSSLSEAAQVTVEALHQLFVAAGVPCDLAQDVRLDLWTKLATNCAYNALSAITGLRYGAVAAHEEARQVMAMLTDELVAVAHAEGVPLAPEAAHAAVRGILDVMPGALSSTAQDLQAGRPTEIDALNGHVLRRGQAHGVPTPVNQTLATLVKVLERTRRA